MVGNQLIQCLPELGIGHGLELAFLAPLPAVAFPACHPLRQSLAYVLAVGEQLDVTRARESREPFDHRLQLHAVIGCLAFGAERFLDLTAADVAQDKRPATRAWIAAAGAV